MENYDLMTRRNFLLRVTTLAGACVVATSAGMLSGCGGGNGGGGGGGGITKFTPPADLSVDDAMKTATSTAVAQLGTTSSVTAEPGTAATGTTVTLAGTETLTQIATDFTNNLPTDPNQIPVPISAPGATLVNVKTAAQLNQSVATMTAFYTNIITSGKLTIPAGSKVTTVSYNLNGTVYTVPILITADSKIIFDPVFSLLPPTPGVTGSTPAPIIQKVGLSGTGSGAQFNAYDGTQLVVANTTVVGNTDANGNLQSVAPTVDSITLAPGVTQLGTTGIVTKAVRTRANGCLTVEFSFQFQIKIGNVVIFSISIFFSITICSTGTSGGGTLG